MLDLDFGRARHSVRTVYGGQRTARPTGEIVTVFSREIIRMHIARHEMDIRIVQPWQISARSAKRSVSLFRFQIADVLADKNVVIDLERDGVLQVRPNGKNCRAFDSLAPASFTLRASRLCRLRPRGSAL